MLVGGIEPNAGGFGSQVRFLPTLARRHQIHLVSAAVVHEGTDREKSQSLSEHLFSHSSLEEEG